ncbi:hypothetical protein PanWU01x14_354740 [Parasponia andersonii]|uniref:Uncharacterized protein n=1 Tax=Parasponia andersonii TaxID=3476 RepID=A0A2P5A9H9_PARAD|nr:hypothetical protein PanWU01x14_354740 [Parasponia andersonii]
MKLKTTIQIHEKILLSFNNKATVAASLWSHDLLLEEITAWMIDAWLVRNSKSILRGENSEEEMEIMISILNET